MIYNPNPLGQERKTILLHNLCADKIIQNSASKILQEVKLNNYPQKSQIYHWVHKFQATGSENNLKKAENPRSGRKLTARCSDNVDAVKDSVARSPKKFLQKCTQELGLSHAQEVGWFVLWHIKPFGVI